VNISAEASKSGVLPDQVQTLAEHIRQLPRLRLRGLMAVPEASPDYASQAKAFRAVFELQQALIHQGFDLDCLSMGMSGDMDAAIAEGSTMVRIGSAIFGARHYPAVK